MMQSEPTIGLADIGTDRRAAELERFARGENAAPVVLAMPDGAGGLEFRDVASKAEYDAEMRNEARRLAAAVNAAAAA